MKKWLVRIVATLLVTTLLGAAGTYYFVRSEVVEMFGGRTETADVHAEIASPAKVVIQNVSVLSEAADAFLPGSSVVLEGETITYVGPDADLSGDPVIIDGEGQYLVPGFIDSHVHLWRSENDLLLYVANGVTQVREMHGTDLHLKWRSQINQGRLGPDLIVIAAQLATYNFAEGIWVDMTAERNVVRSDADVRKTVGSLLKAGFDGLKASSYLSGPAYKAASMETRDHSARFVGHIPVAATLDDLWASNQSEVAHVEEFMKALDREFGEYNSKNTDAFLEFVRQRSDEVARNVKDKEIVVTSTLAIVDSFANQKTDLDETLKSVELEYVNPGVASGQAMGWLPDMNRYRVPEAYRTGDWKQRYGLYWKAYAEAKDILFKAFLNAGVTQLAGTDANVPVMVPGFSLHDEMKAMQAAGMTPAQVLASATVNPSEWMGLKSGQIREGYEANLVLLSDNPLDDIAATKSIDMVFVNGKMLTKDNIKALLKSVLDANAESREVDIQAFQ